MKNQNKISGGQKSGDHGGAVRSGSVRRQAGEDDDVAGARRDRHGIGRVLETAPAEVGHFLFV